MLIIVALSVACMAWPVFGCPPSEDIGPLCDCRVWGSEVMMTCHDVLSPEDLVPPMRALSMRNSKIFSLQFEDSTLQYIPHGIFKGVSIERVRFFRSEIMSLSDTDVAFAGLEDSLTEIRATEAEYIASWDWQQLRNLQNLDLIDVNQIVLGALDEPLPRLPRLTALGITKAALTHVADGAFAELPGLKILSLKDNELVELKRKMLPDPADRLAILDLSNNQISHLPEDFFFSLPNIDTVHLDDNKFIVLTEEPFSHSFRQLHELTLTANPLRCDCRMRWLADLRTPSKFVAACTEPEALKGKSLAYLDAKDLWC